MSTDSTSLSLPGKLVGMGSPTWSTAHDIPRRRVLQALALAATAPPLLAACSSGSEPLSTVLETSEDDPGISLSPVDEGVDADTGSDVGDDEAAADSGINTDIAGDITGDPTSSSSAGGATSSIAFTYLNSGETGTLGDFNGKPTVLNFFASWCPPCRQEMPDFEEAHLKYADQVNFLGLATNDEDGAAADLVTETGVTYPIGTDQNQDAYFALGGIAMPTTIFIDANGEVVNTWFGILIPSDLDVLIQELL